MELIPASMMLVALVGSCAIFFLAGVEYSNSRWRVEIERDRLERWLDTRRGTTMTDRANTTTGTGYRGRRDAYRSWLDRRF